MMEKKIIDYYAVLGLQRDASDEEIHQAYRKLAKKYHPDVPKGDEDNFKQLSEAYHVLHDSIERKKYDLLLPGSIKGYEGSPVQIMFDAHFSAYFFGVGIVYAGIVFLLFFMLDIFNFLAVSASITMYGIILFILFKKYIKEHN